MRLPEQVISLETLNLGDKKSNNGNSLISNDDEMPDVTPEEDAQFFTDMDVNELNPPEKLPMTSELLDIGSAKSSNAAHEIKSYSVQQITKEVHQSFIQAVNSEAIAKMQEILDKCLDASSRAILLNTVDEHGKTAVHYAAEAGNCVSLKYLVRTNHARFVSNEWRILPLHLAAKNGHVEAIDYLIGHTYGNPNYVMKENGYTALHLAIENSHYACVIKLLKLGANPLLKTKNSKSALDLAKSGNIQNFLNSLIPATQILLDASWTPYCQKRDATYNENLRKYLGWRRTGKNWNEFKKILSTAFENKGEPEVKNIIKMQCQTMVRSLGNKQASEQFLYYLCVNGYHEIVEFLLNYSIDFTRSTYKGESSLAMKYLGLYCAIDACRLSVVEVLLKSNERAQYYLYPKILLEEKAEEQSRKITPLEFAEKKLKTHENSERADQYRKIFQLVQRKCKEVPSSHLATPPKSETPSPTIRKRRLDFSDIKEVEQFIPDIEPNSELGSFKIEKRDAVKDNTLVHSTTQSSKKHDIKTSTDEQQQLVDKNHRAIGIWGEAHLFFSLKKRYEKKYQMQIIEPANEVNSLKLSKISNAPDNLPIEIVIEWPNKSKWEQWIKDKQDKFVDPGTQSYDLKVTKKYNSHSIERYIEVKSTTAKDKSIAVLTGKEFYFMREHLKDYRFFRCYNAGNKEAYFIKYINFDKLLTDKNSPVVELKFYI